MQLQGAVTYEAYQRSDNKIKQENSMQRLISLDCTRIHELKPKWHYPILCGLIKEKNNLQYWQQAQLNCVLVYLLAQISCPVDTGIPYAIRVVETLFLWFYRIQEDIYISLMMFNIFQSKACFFYQRFIYLFIYFIIVFPSSDGSMVETCLSPMVPYRWENFHEEMGDAGRIMLAVLSLAQQNSAVTLHRIFREQ